MAFGWEMVHNWNVKEKLAHFKELPWEPAVGCLYLTKPLLKSVCFCTELCFWHILLDSLERADSERGFHAPCCRVEHMRRRWAGTWAHWPTEEAAGRVLHRGCLPQPSPGGNGCKGGDEPDYELYIMGYFERRLVGICTTLWNVKL